VVMMQNASVVDLSLSKVITKQIRKYLIIFTFRYISTLPMDVMQRNCNRRFRCFCMVWSGL